MIHRELDIERIVPWLVSGASGLYVLARMRRFSRAEPSADPLPRFLIDQSDVILTLCSSPVVWYLSRRRSAGRRLGATSRALHQLRQVFTAMVIGTGLLARRGRAAKQRELAALAQRLHDIVRDGSYLLSDLDELCADTQPDPRASDYSPLLDRWQGLR